MSLSASGLGAAATTISCPSLAGGYTRAVTHLRGVVSGSCVLNGTASDMVSFAIEADIVPSGGGVLGPLTRADFDGVFVVSPAG
jgi:hypothetical protein